MDIITQFLDDNANDEDNMQFIKHAVISRKKHLQQLANETNAMKNAINNITDISLLNTIHNRCDAMQKIFDNERKQRNIL
jgi:hypothetical protein